MRTYRAVNGRERGDGYDAYVRPVTRRDRVPGGIRYVVVYRAVGGSSHRAVRYCYDWDEAVWAAKYGCVGDADRVGR